MIIEDIMYLEGNGSYIEIFLDSFSHKGKIRVHKSFIINMQRIMKMRAKEGGKEGVKIKGSYVLIPLGRCYEKQAKER